MATVVEDFRPEGRTRRLVLVAGLLVVALAAVWYGFFRGGDDVTTAPAAQPAPQEQTDAASGSVAEVKTGAKAPTKAEAAKAAATTATAPVETFEVFAPRDPFEPLVKAPAAKAGAGAGTGEGARSGASQNVAGHTVRVVDVFESKKGMRVQVQVDGTVHTVGKGDSFADHFEVLSIAEGCATMLYGDDQFTLCKGEEILK